MLQRIPRCMGEGTWAYQWVIRYLRIFFLNEWIYTKNGDVGKGNSFKISWFGVSFHVFFSGLYSLPSSSCFFYVFGTWGWWVTSCTPWKNNMEPTNHPFRKENDLPNLHDYVPCESSGVYWQLGTGRSGLLKPCNTGTIIMTVFRRWPLSTFTWTVTPVGWVVVLGYPAVT